MEQVYLPGDLRTRLLDLMKEKNVTQGEVAALLNISESTLSRFFSGKSDKLPAKHLKSLAKRFEVSSDFLLGIVNEPDRKNYDVAELGLSVQAARNLYTGKVNPEVVSRLLENPQFANATFAIEQYCNGDLTTAFAAQNRLYTTLANALIGTVPTTAAKQTAAAVTHLRQPAYQADTTTIQNYFMGAVRDIKKEYKTDSAAMQKMTATIAKQIFENVTRGQDMRSPHITPDMVADAVVTSVSGLDGMDEEKQKVVKDIMLTLLQSSLPPDNTNGEN